MPESLSKAVVGVLAARPGLKSREIVAALRLVGLAATRADVNALLYGALRALVRKDEQHRWSLVEPAPAAKRLPSRARGPRQSWTEEQLVLVLWAMPVMRAVAKATGREFSAIAMKMANLLAIATDGHEGLANGSTLDRAVVAKYRDDQHGLESVAARALSGTALTTDRVAEVREHALRLLKELAIPLHAGVLAELLTARDPTHVCRRPTVLRALRGLPGVAEDPPEVFAYRG